VALERRFYPTPEPKPSFRFGVQARKRERFGRLLLDWTGPIEMVDPNCLDPRDEIFRPLH